MSRRSRESKVVAVALGAWAGVALGGAGGCLTPDGYLRDDAGAGAGGVPVASAGGANGAGGAGQGGATLLGSGGSGAGGRSGVGGSGAGGRTAAGGASGAAGATGAGGATASGGGTGTGTVLFSDDFEGGAPSQWFLSDSTGMIGVASIKADGSNVYDLDVSMSKVFLAAAGNVAWTDVVVQARVKIISFNGSSSSYYAGICARVQDAMNYYCGILRSDGKLSVRGEIGGSGSTLGSAVSAGITTGTWYTVKLQASGSTLTFYVNGTLMDTVTDTSLATGGIALAVDNGDAEFDDVRVTVP
jgi:hypothetical protein